HTALGSAQRRFVKDALFHHSSLEPLSQQFPSRSLPDGPKQEVMVDVVEGPLDVRVQDPLLPPIWAADVVGLGEGILASSARPEAVAASLESGLPFGFQRAFDHCLKAAVD